MQDAAHGAGAREEFFHHALNPFAESGLIQVQAEDVLPAVKGFQATVILILPADFQWGHDGLQFGEHRVRRGLEGGTVVLDALQVPGIAGEGERDQDEIVRVQPAVEVLFDRFAEADGQFLRRVHAAPMNS